MDSYEQYVKAKPVDVGVATLPPDGKRTWDAMRGNQIVMIDAARVASYAKLTGLDQTPRGEHKAAEIIGSRELFKKEYEQRAEIGDVSVKATLDARHLNRGLEHPVDRERIDAARAQGKDLSNVISLADRRLGPGVTEQATEGQYKGYVVEKNPHYALVQDGKRASVHELKAVAEQFQKGHKVDIGYAGSRVEFTDRTREKQLAVGGLSR